MNTSTGQLESINTSRHSSVRGSNLEQSNSQFMIAKELLRGNGTSRTVSKAPRVERSRLVTSSSDEEHQGLKRTYLDRKKPGE